MSEQTGRLHRALQLFVIVVLGLGGPIAALVAVTPSARAGPCDQVLGVITGDWTISNAQVCNGIVYTVDGTININAGGSLTLIDGGLKFSKDRSHASYALTVNPGGELVLDNSIVTTQTDAIAPFVKLALTVSGPNSRFAMTSGSMLKFPGWFNATSATINMTDSMITGLSSTDLLGLGIYSDDNDDAPLVAWASSTATLYRSRIERIYQNGSAGGDPNATGPIQGNLILSAGSNLYAYDTYLGVDYSNVRGLHNELRVDGTSNAYLYNVTIDRAQDPTAKSNWQPAYVPTAAGGSVHLFRWFHATAVDSTAFPVSGATITSTLSPSAQTAQYPDNSLSTTPTPRTLWYLGRSASGANAWTQTGSNGVAVIPLWSDQITVSSLPNAESFGNYEELATFTPPPPAPLTSVSGGAFFPPYPAIDPNDNNKWLTMTFTDLKVRTGPDLALSPGDYTATLTVTQNQPFTVQARIYNQGQTPATNVDIAAYLDGNRGSQVARVNGLSIAASPGFVDQIMNVAGISSLGSHFLMLFADPDNVIDEGGAAQESNNVANLALDVQLPPNGFVAIQTPSPGQSVEPGSALSVTGFVRDPNSTGLNGVPLRIELRSATSAIATNLTTSQGFGGSFAGTIDVPSNTAEGSYTVVVTSTSGPITPDSRTVVVRKNFSFLTMPVPFLGIPMWLLLVIVVAVVALAVGAHLYVKVYGVGKVVECGECGSFISQGSTTCPKCGVEFEREMAKCSNCQAWIPLDVKQCPDCGVDFATGKMEAEDYQVKMRMQYDEVVQKFRRDASGQLGRSLTEAEFQEWWRSQPTFVTFGDWLLEEEEMRKSGSKPCLACGTLNSVTATVCHKCGTYLKEGRKGPSAGTSGRRAVPGEGQDGDPGLGPSGAVPAKVIKKAGPPTTFGPKRAPKKPEAQQDEGSEAQSSGDRTSVDDL